LNKSDSTPCITNDAGALTALLGFFSRSSKVLSQLLIVKVAIAKIKVTILFIFIFYRVLNFILPFLPKHESSAVSIDEDFPEFINLFNLESKV
jgi:hypothetical protein